MKTPLRSLVRFRCLLPAICLVCLTIQTMALPPRQWVRSHTAGGRTSKPLAIHVDADNQIVLGGTCQTGVNDRDYFVIKYRPDGGTAWQYRHASPLNDEMRAMTLESGTNVLITGSSVTVKVAASGLKSWELPLSGRDIATDQIAVYIAGFSDTNLSIAKFDKSGEILWTRTNLFPLSVNTFPKN